MARDRRPARAPRGRARPRPRGLTRIRARRGRAIIRGLTSLAKATLHAAIRGRYVLLYAWTGLWMALTPVTGRDWLWFDIAGDLLLGRNPGVDWLRDPPRGLHTLTLSDLHIGPLSIIGGLGFRIFPGNTYLPAAWLATLAGPLIVLAAEHAAVRARGLRSAVFDPRLALTTLVAGAAFLAAWVNAAWYWDHLDEVLTVVSGALAVWAITARRPALAGVGVGLAIAAKLTGIFFLPLLVCFPRKQIARAVWPAALVAGAAWLPFVIAEPSSLRTAEKVIGAPGSPLHLLGVSVSGGAPGWLRPLQVALGLALGFAAVARGRWPAAIVVATAARLALDPATFGYYNAPLFFGALVYDLLGPRRPLPLVSLATAAAFLVAPDVLDSGRAEGAVRLVFAAALAVALLVPLRSFPWTGRARARLQRTPT